MLNMNFVPEDYIQTRESGRINLIYFALFAIVMAALASSFAVIKIRQQAISEREKALDVEMAQKKEDLKKVEQLQWKRNAMWKTALTTAELIEPIPRSIILADLTNNLPGGVSLLKVGLIQKKPKVPRNRSVAANTSKYNEAQAKKTGGLSPKKVSLEKLLETYVDIEGLAPTDLQVAAFIERLGASGLLENVALVESKEHKANDLTFRQFKLTAMLKKDLHLTDEDIHKISVKAVHKF